MRCQYMLDPRPTLMLARMALRYTDPLAPDDHIVCKV